MEDSNEWQVFVRKPRHNASEDFYVENPVRIVQHNMTISYAWVKQNDMFAYKYVQLVVNEAKQLAALRFSVEGGEDYYRATMPQNSKAGHAMQIGADALVKKLVGLGYERFRSLPLIKQGSLYVIGKGDSRG